MNVALAAAGLVVAFAGIVFFLLLRRLSSPAHGLDFDPQWLSEFSMARYRPMERLLDGSDCEFLETQRGFTPEIAKTLRANRRRIFRGYLKCLRRDFGRLEAAARILMLHASQDRPDLAKALFRRRLLFTYAMGMAEVRLALHSVGLGRVDIHGLLESLDGMKGQISEVALAQQPARM